MLVLLTRGREGRGGEGCLGLGLKGRGIREGGRENKNGSERMREKEASLLLSQ